MRKYERLFLMICALFASRAALSQPAPAGEFRVNNWTTVAQHHPKVTRQLGVPEPGFIVVWEGGGFGATTTDIWAAVYDSAGAKVLDDFKVNSYTTSFQTYPAVAGNHDGTFMVAWESVGQEEVGSYGIRAQRVSAAGAPIGVEFLVASYTTGAQRHPSIAPGITGTHIAFEGPGPGDGDGIFLSNDTSATPSLVNAYTPGSQRSASISGSISIVPGAPDYVVVWRGNGVDDGDQGIYGRVFDSSGNSLGSDFRINTTTAQGQTLPAVAADPFSLGYVVVWETPNGGLHDVYGQRLNANGTPRGPEFRVNTYTIGNQDQPQVAVDGKSNFVVVWSSYQDGNHRSVHAQAFSPSGARHGAEYRLNSYIQEDQRMPSVAAIADGKFITVWQSFRQVDQSSGEDVYARFFDVPYPIGDANGDDMVDVLDVFHLINTLFAGGPDSVGPADVNGDGKTDVNDVFYLINYLFSGGPPPV
jgi:hypothetical protein